jgi:hypothetical protein
MREYMGELELTPIKPLRLRLAGGRFRFESNLLYRAPQDFSTARSVQEEKGRFTELGVGATLSWVVLDAAYTSYDNPGTYAFRTGRWRVRAEVPVTTNVSVATEFAKDRFGETAPISYGDYDARRGGLFVRWHQ